MSSPARSTRDPGAAVEGVAEVLYTSGKVHQDTSLPGVKASKSTMPAGHLSLMRMPDSTIHFQWTAVPDNVIVNANDYDADYSISQLHSLKRKSNKLMVVLSANGAPASSLPPFVFEAGAPAVKTFLTHLQVNLASLAGVGNTPQLRPVVDDFNLFVVEPAKESSVGAAIASTVQRAPKKLQEVKWKVLEGAATVTHFFRQVVTNNVGFGNSEHTTLAHDSFVQMQPLVIGGGDDDVAAAPPAASRTNESRANPYTSASVDATSHVRCRERQQIGELGQFDVMDSVSPQDWVIPECTREHPVTAAEWAEYFEPSGKMKEGAAETELRRRIFKGGFDEGIRAKGWMFIFGYVVPKDEEAETFFARKADEYKVMQKQWDSVTPTQMLNNSAFRDRIERVAKDVARTDRETAYFSENGPHLESLGSILYTWCMYNFDLGYVQGMSDMAAVILSVVDDEVAAFWCFVGLMDTEHGAQSNFATNQLGMKRQLNELATLVRFLDPGLMECLEQNDCGNMFFAFRWLLVFLKREFSVPDVICMWDCMWSKHLTTKFHLFLCLAIIRDNREKILQLEFDQMLQHFNTLAGQIDCQKMITDAEAICVELAERGGLPVAIKEFFDTEMWNDTASASPDGAVVPDGEAVTSDTGADKPGGAADAEDPGRDKSWVDVGGLK